MSQKILLSILFLLPMLCPIQAQFPGGSWEFGWETDMDTTYVLNLEDDWDLQDSIEFFVDNQQSTTLNLEIEYDFDDDLAIEIDGPESVSVPANTNETFEITITGKTEEEIRSFGADTSMDIVVRARQTAGSTDVRTEEIDGAMKFPRILKLKPTLNEPTDELFAGSSVQAILLVENEGNANDAISSAEASIRNCPHLSVNKLETLENQVIEPTGVNGGVGSTFELRVEASSSHQERICDVTVTIYSEGAQTSHSSTISVQVKAPTTNTDKPVFEDDTTTNSEDNTSLPWISSFEFIMVFLFASIFVRKH
ncbi:MAG: hypothetical protein VW230_02105 [Candidatus Poseidoniales archaeon]